MCPRLVIALGILSFGTSAHAIITWDLTTIAGSARINEGLYFPVTPSTAAGTGTYSSFLRLQTTGSEQGYNASANAMPDVKSSFSIEISYANVQATAVTTTSGPGAGVAYFSFGVDLNESSSGSNPLLSLDKLQLYVGPNQASPNASSLANLTSTAGMVKVYDMDLASAISGGNTSGIAASDSEVLMNQSLSGSGSGRSDLVFLVPQTAFTSVPGIQSTWFVYLFTQMGAKGGNYTSEGGFEEWQRVSGETFSPPNLVPEASANGIGLVSLLAFVMASKVRSEWRSVQAPSIYRDCPSKDDSGV